MEESKSKDKEYEKWLSLISKPLNPVEDTEKPKRYIDKKEEYRMGEEEGEEEHYQDKGISHNKKLGLLNNEYSLTGRVNERIREEMKGLRKELEESRLEGRPFEKQEEDYNKFEKKIKGPSSKYE